LACPQVFEGRGNTQGGPEFPLAFRPRGPPPAWGKRTLRLGPVRSPRFASAAQFRSASRWGRARTPADEGREIPAGPTGPGTYGPGPRFPRARIFSQGNPPGPARKQTPVLRSRTRSKQGIGGRNYSGGRSPSVGPLPLGSASGPGKPEKNWELSGSLLRSLSLGASPTGPSFAAVMLFNRPPAETSLGKPRPKPALSLGTRNWRVGSALLRATKPREEEACCALARAAGPSSSIPKPG